MNTKAQGNIGVAQAIAHYSTKGFEVLVPLGDNTKYDLVVDEGRSLLKVQVKTTQYFRKGSYIVSLRTNGGNRSGSSKVSYINAVDTDFIFIYVVPTGEKYIFPVIELEGKAHVSLKNKTAFLV